MSGKGGLVSQGCRPQASGVSPSRVRGRPLAGVVGRDSIMERAIRDKGEELFIRLRGNAVLGDEEPQEPEGKFRKLAFSARCRKTRPLRGRNGSLRS